MAKTTTMTLMMMMMLMLMMMMMMIYLTVFRFFSKKIHQFCISSLFSKV